MQCSTLGFPKKFRICHDNLQMSVVVDSVEKKVMIKPQDIDSTNLIMALSSKLPTVGTALRRIVLNNTYYGCKLQIMTPTLVMEIKSNIALAWFLDIIPSYGNGKMGQDEIVLHSKDPFLV